MSLAELRPHLHTLPDRPDWIPYRTSYYAETWGFCLSQRAARRAARRRLRGVHRLDARARATSATASCVLPGEDGDEVLISTHVCHPSLADDNLSGIAVAAALARDLGGAPPPLHATGSSSRPARSARSPGSRATASASPRIRHGLTLTCLGDGAPFTYKRTRRRRRPRSIAPPRSRCATAACRTSVIDFFPYGYDERQYNSPGLPRCRSAR